MKICTVIGARPQFVKASMISKEIYSKNEINEVIIHTGQHFDKNMSHIFFDEMNIPKPDYNLGIQSLPHGAMTGRQLEEIEKVLAHEKPDWVLVYGDTNSTIAGALASAKLQIPVIHIEAGIRSFNKRMPEEINRILTDHISHLLFVPTETAKKNLENEGIQNKKIKLVGDVMYDAALCFGKVAEGKSKILKFLNITPNEYILSTIHRPENTDHEKRLKNIFDALGESNFPVILPLHPRTKKKIRDYDIKLSNKIIIIDPIGYLDMIMLEKNAKIIVTDSGGIQKEAYFFNIPCLTLRNDTEWVELVSVGANYLVGADKAEIISLINTQDFSFKVENFYGDGDASKKIINIIINY